MGWLGGAVSDIAPDATAYVHRRARMLVELTSAWPTPENPSTPLSPIPPDIRDWVGQLWEILLPHTTGRSYQNFPDPELQDWARAYYGDKPGPIGKAQGEVDPDSAFSHSQGIPLPLIRWARGRPATFPVQIRREGRALNLNSGKTGR